MIETIESRRAVASAAVPHLDRSAKSMIIDRRIAVAFACLCTIVTVHAGPVKEAFLKLTDEADSFELRLVSPFLADPSLDAMRVALKGTAPVADFCRSVEFKHDVPRQPPDKGVFRFKCRCIGDYQGTFRKGDRVLLEFTLHHWTHIRSKSLDDGYDVYLEDSFLSRLLGNDRIRADMERARRLAEEPNRTLEPTAMGVTPPAAQEPRRP